MTYPPRAVNGIMVGGFLAPSLEKAVSPAEALPLLRETSYMIDIDATLVRRDMETFKKQFLDVFDARARTILSLLKKTPWDLFVAHIPETDRINHFMWRCLEEDGSENQRFFLDFYRRVDRLVGDVAARLGEHDTLIMLSDHGFCRTRREVQLNLWLRESGFLDWEGDPGHKISAISSASRAIALVPGRIHILTKSVWERGSVAEEDVGKTRRELIDALAALSDPESGAPVCNKIMPSEEAFSGPYVGDAPHIVVDPHDGYDLKGALGGRGVFTKGHISGMHTYHDALMCISSGDIEAGDHGICDASATVLSLLGIDRPDDFDGRSVIPGDGE